MRHEDVESYTWTKDHRPKTNDLQAAPYGLRSLVFGPWSKDVDSRTWTKDLQAAPIGLWSMVYGLWSGLRTPHPLRCRSRVPGVTLIEVLVSVVILAFGAVVVMEALARVAYAMTLAEGYSGSHLVALAKMSDLERAARAGEGLREHDHGRVQLGQQWFEWDSLAPPVEEASRAQSLALTVTWSHGRKTFERHLETLVMIPKAETKAP